ncbi:MAG: histidine phosphatase family protein [Planctomycetaceae bacterium]|nr:histidine phosphatase family protein [Planctomycetaceae bacterium]
MTTTLYLIRHGATDANLARPYILQGRGVDLNLNATGRAQAAAVGEFLKTRKLNHVYCSVLKRAVETAQAVAHPHGFEPERLEDITECNVGQWEGMDWDSIALKHPEEFRLFNEDPAESPYLGGECYRDVLTRVAPAFQCLLEKHAGETIAVVAHNIVNRVYTAHLLGLELRKAKGLRQANGCINVIRAEKELIVLETMNSCFHLPPELH